MSNQTVGAVYAQIITDVIDSSRVDFEEMGVEESVLEDLKKVSSSSRHAKSIHLFPTAVRTHFVASLLHRVSFCCNF
jgi:transcription initiation factor TFIIA large subunit